MIKRLIYVILFIVYTLLVATIFFPMIIITGWDKTEGILLMPLYKIVDRL